jgi:hypothetical protein
MAYIVQSWARRITNSVIVRVKVTISQATGWLGLAAALRRGGLMLCAVGGLALCANSSATLPPRLPKPEADPRVLRLERFFERYRCPNPKHVTEYLLAADDYGLDYRLLPALSIRETHCGIEETRNNRWGYHPGRVGFPSIETGIYYVARQLAENPTYRGKSLRDKLFTYNPRPAYPREVQRIMLEIEQEEIE